MFAGLSLAFVLAEIRERLTMKNTVKFINISSVRQCFFVLALLLSAFSFQEAEAQTSGRKLIKFSGLVVEGDSSNGIPGAHIYVKQANRGTVTNGLGLFSIYVREGDSVRVSFTGFEDFYVVIPRRTNPVYSLLIDMKADTLLLQEIEIFPYPSFEVFKEAVLAMEDDKTVQQKNLEKNLNPEEINVMVMKMPTGASGNSRQFFSNQVSRQHNQFFAPTLSLLNPFAWKEFIKSIKRGDHKKKIILRDDD